MFALFRKNIIGKHLLFELYGTLNESQLSPEKQNQDTEDPSENGRVQITLLFSAN